MDTPQTEQMRTHALNDFVGGLVSKLRSDTSLFLLEAGMEPSRVEEVISDGKIKWERLSYDELKTIAPDSDEIAPGTNRAWKHLSDEQLERIANGTPAEDVVHGTNLD